VDLCRARWEDVGVLRVDPRSKTGSVPDDIPPAFLMRGYRDETLLNLFLFYFPLRLITEIVTATNANAATIAWPRDKQWRHLQVGEWMRWLGLWVLMTLYPINGSRRLYWRGSLAFAKYMPERRFEAILRAFTLPQYTHDDAKWGGEGRAFYEVKRFDKFWETRRFMDEIRERFQAAIKPGGWICIDESMLSWLGRALKLPGWKIIKRKPHPIGLEAKTAACSVTGIMIDFEFQEGTDPMGFFEYVNDYNRSTAWLLRLTKKWHGKEKRTVIADAAFAQVRAAAALHLEGGLHLIGNIKGCNKHFPQAALRSETPAYQRDRLICMTKKAVISSGAFEDEPMTVYATGWRCTEKMVVTYVHTGGATTVGSDRIKRKYTQLSNGEVTSKSYHVKRPKVSAEYQYRMGAIDNHNWRRQSGKSVKALERVCVTRSTKDRIFINAVGWIIINLFLAKKHFVYGGGHGSDTDETETASEFQEKVAMALINNQHLAEAPIGTTPDGRTINSLESCVKHPKYKSNLCKFCHQRRTVYICNVCSNPGRSKVRKEKSSKGNVKMTDPGFNHFCKGGCFAQHKCGATSHRRPRGSLPKADGFTI